MSSYNSKGSNERSMATGVLKLIIFAVVVSFILPSSLRWLMSFTFIARVFQGTSTIVFSRFNEALVYFTDFVGDNLVTKELNVFQLVGKYIEKMIAFWIEFFS